MSVSGRNGRRDIVDDVIAALEFYEALGFERIPVHLRTGMQSFPGERGKAPVDSGRESTSRQGLPRNPAEDKASQLAGLREEIGDCRRCKLSAQRKNIVFGEGDPDARLMFVGEAPGRDEDIQGMPFVGEAGMLLTKLIEKMGFRRRDVYIGNVIKCRPPMNRDPEEDEIAACRPFIERQIRIIMPEVLITLGRVALQTLQGNPKAKITAVRGDFFAYEGIPVMPTFHPAYLLRNPKDKWLTWADAQKVMERLKKEE